MLALEPHLKARLQALSALTGCAVRTGTELSDRRMVPAADVRCSRAQVPESKTGAVMVSPEWTVALLVRLGAKTGEQAFGNCPGFTFKADTTKAEHFSSETGLREKDAALIIEVNRSGELTCDNFSTRNFALFVSGTTETQTQSVATVAAES